MEQKLKGRPGKKQVRPEAVLAAVLLSGIVGPIDASIVNVNLPVIREDLGASLVLAEWVPMVYLFVLSTLLLTRGRLGDMFGFRHPFLGGVTIFTFASALCGLAPTVGWLIAARMGQALGTAMFMAVIPAIITSVFPPERRGRALELNGMVVALGLALGPTLGGTITGLWGWRWIFYINVPIGVLGLVLGYLAVPSGEERQDQKFGFWGSLLAAAGLVGLLLFFSHGGRWGWQAIPSLLTLALELACLVIFVLVENTLPQPMLHLSLFRHRPFALANLAAPFNFMAQYVLVFLTPFYLNHLGLSSQVIGLTMTISPLVVLVVAPISGALSDRLGTRSLAAAGAALCSVALVLLAVTLPGRGRNIIPWCLTLFGLGTGLFQSPNNSAVMGAAPQQFLGVASATLAVVRNVGMVLGIAVGGAVFTAGLGGSGKETFVNALTLAYLVAACLAATGVPLSWLARSQALSSGQSPGSRPC